MLSIGTPLRLMIVHLVLLADIEVSSNDCLDEAVGVPLQRLSARCAIAYSLQQVDCAFERLEQKLPYEIITVYANFAYRVDVQAMRKL